MEQDLKIKLFENKNRDTVEIAPYILTYEPPKPNGRENSRRKIVYDIISLLKSENEIIIEVNTSLMSIKSGDKKEYVFGLIDRLKSQGLNYMYRKTPSTTKRSIFSFLFGGSEEVHEVILHVPESMWRTQELKDLLPVFGAKYYIFGENSEANAHLENMYRMTDEDKINFFKLIVFDPGVLDRMSINTRHLSLQDLRKMLQLS